MTPGSKIEIKIIRAQRALDKIANINNLLSDLRYLENLELEDINHLVANYDDAEVDKIAQYRQGNAPSTITSWDPDRKYNEALDKETAEVIRRFREKLKEVKTAYEQEVAELHERAKLTDSRPALIDQVKKDCSDYLAVMKRNSVFLYAEDQNYGSEQVIASTSDSEFVGDKNEPGYNDYYKIINLLMSKSHYEAILSNSIVCRASSYNFSDRYIIIPKNTCAFTSLISFSDFTKLSRYLFDVNYNGKLRPWNVEANMAKFNSTVFRLRCLSWWKKVKEKYEEASPYSSFYYFNRWVNDNYPITDDYDMGEVLDSMNEILEVQKTMPPSLKLPASLMPVKNKLNTTALIEKLESTLNDTDKNLMCNAYKILIHGEYYAFKVTEWYQYLYDNLH
jgi:hypothetical protein